MEKRILRCIRTAAVFGLAIVLSTGAEPVPPAGPASPLVKRPAEYDAVQRRLASGWNTYENDSVLSHVLMPEGLAIRLGLEKGGEVLSEALIGREEIIPGARTWNGETTELDLTWNGVSIKVQSAASDDGLVLLVTPEKGCSNAFLTVESKMLWDRPGRIERRDSTLNAVLPGERKITIQTSRPVAKWIGDKLCLPLSEGPLVITTGSACSVGKGAEIIAAARNKMIASREKYGDSMELYRAMQCVLAWDTIYEPQYDRVVATVSRVWNRSDLWQGWVLFDWDTYFASYIASIDNKDLAYACAYEMTRHLTPEGFIPNYAAGRGSSFDRSQPPVGSLMVRELYRHYRDQWFIDSLFDALLSWNRWWPEERIIDGYLAWGSNPWPEGRKGKLAAHSQRAARLESGLDNSVMWDDVSFNKETCTLELACVDLMSFYIADCKALADLADVLGRSEAAELRQRTDHFTAKLQTLWNDEAGIFMNRRTDTGEFDDSLSPALFYPMLAGACTQEQADRMILNYLLHPEKFGGDWLITMTPWDDPAWKDNDYWRGRIWAPVNFLVYLGLRNVDCAEARQEVAEKSGKLILKEWLEKGHVHENYSPVTGEGCIEESDKFYHWGGLLSTIALIEEGFYPSPEQPLKKIFLPAKHAK
jgi:hypothetical protein